tara:strand:- start:306 stop:557 length:252 start_codon:yes stop_codon:yes gene_type:complete
MDKDLNKTQKGANMTNPTKNIIIDEDNELLIDTEMAEELAYDAAVFEEAMKDMMDVEFYPEMLIPEGDGDDYSPTDDGSWLDR